jgi:hypothetical protein
VICSLDGQVKFISVNCISLSESHTPLQHEKTLRELNSNTRAETSPGLAVYIQASLM